MDLAAIRAKVKVLIGDSGYDNTALDIVINRVYQRSLPLEFTLEALKSEFTQTTSEGISEYTVDPDLYLVIREPAYLDGTPVSFYVDKARFYGANPQGVPCAITGVSIASSQFTIAGNFASTFAAPNTFRVYGSTGNNGMYTASVVAYASNVTTITVVETISDATVDGTIIAQSNNRPHSVLYVEHKLVFAPPPDTNYGANWQFKADTIVPPTALVQTTDEPIEKLWGMVISIDTAIEIMMDVGRTEDAKGLWELRKIEAMKIGQKEIAQFLYKRAKPQF